jgi:tetratricopeptide (TPR) repeat protein
MVKGHRQQCHLKIAQVLEAQSSEELQTRPEIIAHHFAESGNIEQSVGYLLTAALRSQEQFANAESISHLTKGLALLSQLPESQGRDQNELSLLIPLSSAYQIARGYAAPEVSPTLARARELVQKIGNSQQVFEIMWVNWTWHLVRADLDLCMQLAEEMMALASEVMDKAMLMEAYVAPAVTFYYRGDFASCTELSRKALAEFEDLDACQRWSLKLGQNSAVVLRCYLALSLWHLGSTEEALQLMDETISLARRVAQPFSLAHALFFASWLFYECKLTDKLTSSADEELAIADQQAFGLWQATGKFHQGAAMLTKGSSKDAVERMASGIESFKALAASLTLPAQLAVLAAGYIQCNRHEEARRALEEACTYAEKNHDRAYLAEIFRLKGSVALAESDRHSARRLFQTAIELAKQSGSKAWELRTAAELSVLQQNKE